MKKVLFRTISILATAALTLAMSVKVSDVVRRRESDIKNKAFFDDCEDYDILFLGTSHVVNGIYPNELWHEYGYTSYNLANHSTTLAVSYWTLINALDYADPKLVVLDCYGWTENEKISGEYAYLHKAMDCFPLSVNKIRAVYDLTWDNPEADTAEMLWDFCLYHNRWNQLEEKDFNVEYNRQRGADRRIEVATPVEYEIIDPGIKYEDISLARTYAEKIIQECQSRDIDIVLTWVPYPPFRSEAQAAAHVIYDVAGDYGIDYINFWDMDTVDYNTDLYDEDSHLNPSGAMKVTNYVGKFINENFDIPDHRQDAGFESWHEDEEKYMQDKKDEIIYQTDPRIYMMLINDDDLDVKLEWNNRNCIDDELFGNLIRNLGINTDVVSGGRSAFVSGKYPERKVQYSDECAAFDEAYSLSVTVYDHETGEQFDNVWLYISPGEETTVTHIYD